MSAEAKKSPTEFFQKVTAWLDSIEISYEVIDHNQIDKNEHSASDGRFFSERGIPTIIGKPVGGNIHSENEWVGLASVGKFTQILEKFLTQ